MWPNTVSLEAAQETQLRFQLRLSDCFVTFVVNVDCEGLCGDLLQNFHKRHLGGDLGLSITRSILRVVIFADRNVFRQVAL